MGGKFSNTTSVLRREVYEPLKHFIDAFALVAIIWNVIAFVVIRRTKKVPRVAKIFSLNLMVSEALTVLIETLRRWMPWPLSKDLARTMSGIFMVASTIIVMFMSIERLFLFNYGYLYLRTFRPHKAHSMMAILWTINIALLLIIRYTVCNGSNLSLGECIHRIIALGLIPVMLVCLSVSVGIYIKIYFILQNIEHDCRNKGFVCPERRGKRYYRTTFLLFLYLLSTILYIVLLVLVALRFDNDLHPKIGFDVIAIISSVWDATLYVAWYQESRMELLKVFVCLCPRLNGKIERMRIEVYSIVLAASRPVRPL